MWNEAIWIVLGGLALYLITTLLIGWLQSRRKKKDKVIPLIKDFWDEEINRISKANPAYRDSSTKKFADKRKEEYAKKNPTKPVSYKKGIKQSRTYGSRSNNHRNDYTPGIVMVDDDYGYQSSMENSNSSSSSSSHSTTGFGAGGAFGGGGAAGYWGGSDHGHSSDSGSSDSGGDGGGSD